VLRTLAIRDFVLIEQAELELGPGFSVLTGETGAGKSMLVDAIELLVGGRGDAGLVAAGAERADLAAQFDIDRDGRLAAWLEERELAGDAGACLVRRVMDRAGRSRCFINGHPATLAQLKEAGELLVDIHGQHAHQSLLRPAAQRELLDAHAGAAALAAETAAHYRAWRRLEQLASEAHAQFRQREDERADLLERVAELRKLAPRAGEWDELCALQKRLAHGSNLLAGAQSSLEALSESEGACLAQLSAVASRLRALRSHDERLSAVLELLESAHAQAGEAVRELRHYASRVDLDPQALRETELRVEALHAAARRQRVRPEELPQQLAGLEQQLAELELAVDPQALEREVAAARTRFEISAGKLSVARRAAAQALSEAVSASMQKLAMAGGAFSVALRALAEAGAAGAEEVEFEVTSHRSLPLRPLARVASGGELSRVSLAIQVVACANSPVGTLVFDEVDAGIGGAVAETVGRALSRLGRERQILCVTHLPQVAAQADAQWRVEKSAARGKVTCSARRLDRSSRVEELARMLGGAEITPTTRKHAAEMLGSRA
jgi:DNA repair protein RecN (Recombination protein N)